MSVNTSRLHIILACTSSEGRSHRSVEELTDCDVFRVLELKRDEPLARVKSATLNDSKRARLTGPSVRSSRGWEGGAWPLCSATAASDTWGSGLAVPACCLKTAECCSCSVWGEEWAPCRDTVIQKFVFSRTKLKAKECVDTNLGSRLNLWDTVAAFPLHFSQEYSISSIYKHKVSSSWKLHHTEKQNSSFYSQRIGEKWKLKTVLFSQARFQEKHSLDVTKKVDRVY